MALRDANRDFEAKKAATQGSTDAAQIQALRDLYNQLQRLDRTIYNLKLARGLAVNGPTIRISQEHSASVVEFCNNIQNFAVVQWWIQVRLAVAHYRNRLGIELDRKAKEFTDQLVMGTAQMLGINTVAIKEAQGRGFVGIEALKQYNATLVQVLENDIRADQENLQKRRQNLAEVQEAETRLRQAQLAVAGLSPAT